MASRGRRNRHGSTSAERIKVVEAIVAELREHGRARLKDRDALLVRVVARTGLDLQTIQRAAADVLPLFREIAERLRESD